MELLAKIEDTISKYQLLTSGAKVLVGVSGGADSVALIHILKELSSEYNLELHIAHLDHQLRGADAKADAQFVRELAGQLNIASTFTARNIKKYQQENKLSLEDAARQLRYQFFFNLLDELEFDKLAVGHHANDQAETILMKFLRGAGLKGLSGIKPQNEKIIRPLIEVQKKELQEYCRKHNLDWRVDSTNQEEICFRNRVRLDLLPQLKEDYNPNLITNLNQMGEIFRVEDEFLRKKTRVRLNEIIIDSSNNKLIIAKDRFLDLDLALQRRIIREIYQELNSSYENLYFHNVEEILALIKSQETGLKKSLPEGVIVKLSYQHIIFILAEADEEIDYFSAWLTAGESIELTEINIRVNSQIIRYDYPWQDELDQDNKAFFDLAQVGSQFKVRQRKDGDSFQPLGMSGTKKVKDFLIDQKIARDRRDKIPVFVTESGAIFWIGELRIDENYKVRDKTDEILMVEIDRLKEV
ncbi:MAG: tRNA lysidine(34) synthetase TilS [Halanaerobacter sp.]